MHKMSYDIQLSRKLHLRLIESWLYDGRFICNAYCTTSQKGFKSKIQMNIVSLQSIFRGFKYIFQISKFIFWNVSRYADLVKPWRTGFFLMIYLDIFIYNFSVVQTCNTFANKNRNLYGFVITWEEYAIKNHLCANDSFDNYFVMSLGLPHFVSNFFSGSK